MRRIQESQITFLAAQENGLINIENVSATNSATFSNNIMDNSWVKILSYAGKNELSVTATGNTLEPNGTSSSKMNYVRGVYKVVADTCTITFMPNGGEGEMAAQTFQKGIAQALNANVFTREEYFFNGWNTEANGNGEHYDDMAEVICTGDTTLYAQWVRKPSATSYTVQYDANGGTGTVYLQAFNKNMTFELRMNEFVREGYKFVGWNTKADGTGESYAEGAKYSGNKSIVLFAQWKLDVPEFPAVRPEYKIEVEGQKGIITRTNDTSIIHKDMYIRWSIGFDTVDGPFAMIAMLDVEWIKGEEGLVGTFNIPVIETNGSISGVNYMLTTDLNANMIGVGEALADMYGMLIK